MSTGTPRASLVAPAAGAASATAPAGLAPTDGTRTDPAISTTVEWPVTRCGTYSGKGCAPTSRRVDVTRPTFSRPTEITNPLFPISGLESVVLLGEVDGKSFRSETTLLAGHHTVTVDGTRIKVVVSMYTAYLGGKLDEVALDRYAQADDGSVWYLGEDVFDYRNGTVAITEGTWLAGRDGPPAMIMPASPKVGDVFRAENITGVVFEEIAVKAVGQSVNGPRGAVAGAVVMQELHLDGSLSNKVFAPGYGEFDTSSGGDVEALALAMPTDRIHEKVPAELRLLSTSAWGILENARLDDWEAARPTLTRMKTLWKGLAAKGYPPRVKARLGQALRALEKSVARKQAAGSSQAALDVAQSALDLELLYRGDVEIDRFNLHAQQLRIYAATKDLHAVTGEVAVLEWIRDRLAGSLGQARATQLDADLRDLRGAASTGNVAAAADLAARAAARVRYGA
ncbi:MAG: bacterial transcriptional activator domain-containing protein [Mycobacteriales bacterium]